ncbi:MAG TPA: hypothetical protein VGU43_00090 [Thermoplasmata archaeon]|nr:hypothetical protein [Thermoplasmata archaeon]
MPPSGTDRGPPWVGAAELGEYAYCPRAWYYRANPPTEAPDPGAVSREKFGRAYHTRELSREAARERSIAALVAAALLLLALGVVLLSWTVRW